MFWHVGYSDVNGFLLCPFLKLATKALFTPGLICIQWGTHLNLNPYGTKDFKLLVRSPGARDARS